MTSKRMVFDIGIFSFGTTVTGIPRYVVEILKRFSGRDDLDIVTICSARDEETTLRNFRAVFPVELPFQSRHFDRYVLPDTPTPRRQSGLKRLENCLKSIFPANSFLDRLIDAARSIKQTALRSPGSTELPFSPIMERLIAESDIYFSPYFKPIPEAAANPSIRNVLFVHDIIPVLFKDLYKNFHFVCGMPWESITTSMLVLVNSETTKRDLLRIYPNISADQVSVTFLGADDRFHPAGDLHAINRILEKYSVPRNVPYILSVAYLDARKNFEHILRSFATFEERYGERFPETRLVISGAAGFGHDRLIRTFESLPQNTRDRIIFTGYVDDEDLPLLYAGATCFCYMSLYEGFGLPPLEAMRCGTPVIASNVSSIPEVVDHAGILIDPNDENGLVEAFLRLSENKILRNELIEKGLRQAEHFSWDRCAEHTLRIIAPELYEDENKEKRV